MAFVDELSFLKAGLMPSHSDGLLLAKPGVLALNAEVVAMTAARQKAGLIGFTTLDSNRGCNFSQDFGLDIDLREKTERSQHQLETFR